MAIVDKTTQKASVNANNLTKQILIDMIDSMLSFESDGGVILSTLKSGASQVAAGAAANELWIDTADNSIKIGV